MLGTREYTLCSPFRANAHNSSFGFVSVFFFWASLYNCLYVNEGKLRQNNFIFTKTEGKLIIQTFLRISSEKLRENEENPVL